jgi:hypothetical protein
MRPRDRRAGKEMGMSIQLVSVRRRAIAALLGIAALSVCVAAAAAWVAMAGPEQPAGACGKGAVQAAAVTKEPIVLPQDDRRPERPVAVGQFGPGLGPGGQRQGQGQGPGGRRGNLFGNNNGIGNNNGLNNQQGMGQMGGGGGGGVLIDPHVRLRADRSEKLEAGRRAALRNRPASGSFSD